MITFAAPWALALLPLPLTVMWLMPPYRRSESSLRAPFLNRLAAILGRRPTDGATIAHGDWSRAVVLAVAWLASVGALARPQIVEPPIVKRLPRRDLLLAVDLSGSMETQDFTDAGGKTVDRLTAVKQVLDDFLSRRAGDRVGLVFFGNAPFVQVPFTEDLKLCRQLLDEAQTKMAGPQTAFGDAIGLAITLFDRSPMKNRVLIALTDGNDTASRVPPRKASEIARDRGIVVHTVAVGDPRAAGEDALDVATLEAVSSATGGLYSFAADREQLATIYARLDKLDAPPAQTVAHRPRRDVYWILLAVGLAATLLLHAIELAARQLRHASDRRRTVASQAEAAA
ncbi:MAG: VWA domain-containing protein [Pirellulales bacterium]|nr:VWA domain-containing protein [Pirellulales bacterium]